MLSQANYNTILTDVMEGDGLARDFEVVRGQRGRLLIPRAAIEGGEDVLIVSG
jgi:hypothetical protein